MVIIITGASHTGKTVLAQRMLEKYKFSYLSIDHLKMGLIRSGNTKLTTQDDDQLTPYLWPIVREMIKTAIENKQNLIVEGCYIPFDWRKDFDQEYLQDSEEYKTLMKKRSTECETVFGQTKGNLGFRRFHLRGKEKVGTEWGLLMLGYDFKQLIRLMNA